MVLHLKKFDLEEISFPNKTEKEAGYSFHNTSYKKYIAVLRSLFVFQNVTKYCSIMRNISTNIKGAYFTLTGNGLMVITYYTCSFCEIVLLVASLLKNILIM
jgi:hypothetical protein